MDERAGPIFGDLLRRFRERAGLTQETLAERAGLSPDAIGLLERGARRHPQRYTVQRLAATLGLSDEERAGFDGAARRAGQTGDGPRSAPARAALPLPATTFVGRAAEIAALSRLLTDPDVRLVTLTGPGGVGKTRLALEAAARLAERFAGGVVFAPLADLRDPALLIDGITRACGFAERAGYAPLEDAIDRLRDQRVLLLLDNLEHLLPGTPAIAALLDACPLLVVLATSRVPLRLRAERQYPVTPLPAAGGGERAHQPAVALFEQRALAVAPGFALTAETTPVVAAICRRLDGLPLALELAAAWVKVLSPQQMLARLDRALPLLTGGARDLPARQRTLRDTLAWSHALLTPAERALLRRAAVFAGGWTLAAAEAVCAAPDEPAVLPGLAALVEASLIQSSALAADTAREPRYTLLETVREYAAELLAASGEEEAMRGRHAAYFLALVEEAQPHLVGPEEGAWLARLDEEGDNLRAALRRALDRREVDAATRFAAVLWRFWSARGHLAEGRRWLEAILALAAPDAPPAGDGGAIAPLRRAMLLHVTAIFARLHGDYPRTEALFEECLAIRRAHADRPGIIAALHNLGITAHEQGDHGRAIRLYEEALPLAREIDSPYAIGFGLTSFGEAVLAAGDPARAAALCEEGLGWFRRIGHTWGIAMALTRLGDTALAAGDRPAAAARYRESLTLSGDLGDPRSAVDTLEGLAAALTKADAALAARLLGAAAALRDHLGMPRAPGRRDAHSRAVDRVGGTLGAEAFAGEWRTGMALTFEQALAVALPAGA